MTRPRTSSKRLPLELPPSASIAELMSIWRGRDTAAWSRAVEIYRLLAEKILQQGEPLLAFDVAREGLAHFSSDVRLRQLQGLALARSGASERARALLEQLRAEGAADEETLGMLGRTYKDGAAQAATPDERRKFLRLAAQTYIQAYETTGGYWTGINAATLTLLCGDEDSARNLAQKVEAEGKAGLVKQPNEYWLLAALGEAALILREWSQASDWYERAAPQAGKSYGDLHSSRRNARLILQYWNQDGSWIDQFLRIPAVVVFAGHMIDRPDRKTPRFPAGMEPAVEMEIRRRIEALKPGIGFSSAACGSDILFLEAMLKAGADVTIVLAYNEQEFVRDSVDFVPGSNWRSRFDEVLRKATRVLTASPQRLEVGGISYEFCNELLLGLAAIRSRQLETKLLPVTIWHGPPGDGPGGVASAVERWSELGYAPDILTLSGTAARGAIKAIGYRRAEHDGAAESVSPTDSRSANDIFASRIVAILFADAVGFSKLNEIGVARFVEHFLGLIAGLAEKFDQAILARNTWGDGLYFIFADVAVAGKFALALSDLISKVNWQEKGLPAELTLRIALHAGPAYEFDDPITNTRSFSGTHVNRAARLEPVTPLGQVYGSEEFAALAATQAREDFICDYVGQVPMAKGYGTLRTYHVRAAPDAQRQVAKSER
jgi:class 3 adenylate cyclase